MTGVATNSDEYVPTTTPTIKANINPLIESPPNKKIANMVSTKGRQLTGPSLSALALTLWSGLGGKAGRKGSITKRPGRNWRQVRADQNL